MSDIKLDNGKPALIKTRIISSRWGWLLLIIAGLLIPQLGGSYAQFLYATILIYFLIALSLTILTGFAGQISIGHAGFWALGAYASAILVTKLGLPFLAGIAIGLCVGALFGAIVALPAMRVQGHYLAIATLSFAILVQQTLLEWESVTGGHQGLVVPRPEIFGYVFDQDHIYGYFLLAIAILAALITENFRRSHTGRSLMALKASPIAAQMAGINRASHLIIAFMISGALTGLSGALYAHLIGFLSADTFTLVMSLMFLSMAVIGGLGSIAGALLGSLYMSLTPEIFRELKDAQMIIYGIVLLLCIRYLPGGLASLPGAIRKSYARPK